MNNKHIFKRLLTYISAYRKSLTLALLFAILQVTTILLGPFFIGKIVDELVGIGQVNFVNAFEYLLFFGGTVLMSTISQLFVNRHINYLSFHVVQDLRNDLMEKIEKLPVATIDMKPHGELTSIMVADIDLISNGLIQGGVQFLTGVLTIIGTIGLMFYTQPKITILVLVLTPLSLVVAQFIAKGVYTRFQKQSQIRGEITGFLEEMLTNNEIIKNLSYEEHAQAQFQEMNGRLFESGWRAHFFSATVNPSTRVVNNLIYASVGVYGAFIVRSGMLTIGALSAFLAYANQYMKPFNEISNVMAEVQSALASCSRVFEILDLEDGVADLPGVSDLEGASGDVRLEHVDFSYVPEKPFIEDFNLDVKQGETIAIVGPTGSGKTTVINLLMRFYEISGGTIFVDDKDMMDYSKKSLRENYGMVLQDTWIFTGTIMDNIRYGKPDSTLDEVINAAKKAQIHHSIKQLPNGYETMLSSKDATLSQGQMQLLCIARMMLLDPPMLILDEATSNIDTRTEIAIQQTFHEMLKGRTSFIIAHRLSTIQTADKILVMKDGAIIEAGPHDELLKEKGFYYELFNSQFAVSE